MKEHGGKDYTVLRKGEKWVDYSERPMKTGEERSRRYYDVVTFPSYSQFGKPIFADNIQRQYKIADGLDLNDLISIGHISKKDPLKDTVSPKDNFLLYFRIPRGKRYVLEPPSEGDKLYLTHLKTEIKYYCRVLSNMRYYYSNTGTIVVTNWKKVTL